MSEVSFQFDGGQEIVGVTSYMNWSAISSEQWCEISPSSSNGDGAIVINVKKNEMPMERSSKITVVSGTNTCILIVTQAASIEALTAGIDYVDLGLPSGTLWATCNVGANKAEEYGDYYNTFEASNLKFDGFWTYPHDGDFDELFDNCEFEMTVYKGVRGRKFIGKNGEWIFFPAAGKTFHGRHETEKNMVFHEEEGVSGYYWTSLGKNNMMGTGYSMWMCCNICWVKNYLSDNLNLYEYSVRAVCPTKNDRLYPKTSSLDGLY